MSKYYNSKRTTGLYDPDAKTPFKISRSKIDLFLECPRCFYLDRKLGVARPPGFPFTLNSAVDALLKQEFNIHRARGTKHPLQEKYGIDAVPVPHEDLEKWRHNFTGVQSLHKPTNFLIFGAIDDLWARPPLNLPLRKGENSPELIVVDYKATAKSGEITELDQEWHDGYKRQMEIYQWLLRQNGYKVSSTGYFVYANGRADKEAFDAKLEFDVTLISYKGKDDWVEPIINAIYNCLNSNAIPLANPNCDYCAYREAAREVSCKK